MIIHHLKDFRKELLAFFDKQTYYDLPHKTWSAWWNKSRDVRMTLYCTTYFYRVDVCPMLAEKATGSTCSFNRISN